MLLEEQKLNIIKNVVRNEIVSEKQSLEKLKKVAKEYERSRLSEHELTKLSAMLNVSSQFSRSIKDLSALELELNNVANADEFMKNNPGILSLINKHANRVLRKIYEEEAVYYSGEASLHERTIHWAHVTLLINEDEHELLNLALEIQNQKNELQYTKGE